MGEDEGGEVGVLLDGALGVESEAGGAGTQGVEGEEAGIDVEELLDEVLSGGVQGETLD